MFKRKKKKTGCETPMLRKPTPPPPPPRPPTSGSNAVKPNPNYVPPASTTKSKQRIVEDIHPVQLHCTVDDLNAYIRKQLGGNYVNNTYVPISATVNTYTLNVEIYLAAINPVDSDYGQRIKLEVKL